MSETRQNQMGRIYLPNGENGVSFQQILMENLGKDVVAEFIIGTDTIARKSGILTAVGAEYIVLYDDVNLIDVICDRASLRFVTFFLPGTRPSVNDTFLSMMPRTGGQADGGAQGTVADAAKSAAPVMVTPSTRTQAALNYAKNRARKLD